MKRTILIFLVAAFANFDAHASIKAFNNSGVDLGHFADMKCSNNLTCTQEAGKLLVSPSSANAGPGSGALYGYLNNRITSVSPSLTAAQCGSTVINTVSSSVTLPEASSVLGCEYSFFVFAPADNAPMVLTPASGDKILTLASAAGDRVTNSVSGSSLTLQAIGIDQWGVLGKEQGTWNDSN